MKIELTIILEDGKTLKNWRYEVLACPTCGLRTVFSKINSINEYSQFICINPKCDFTDNLEEEKED